jgi:hypothetical protein
VYQEIQDERDEQTARRLRKRARGFDGQEELLERAEGGSVKTRVLEALAASYRNVAKTLEERSRPA